MNAKADMPEISGGWEPTITVGPLEDKLSFVKHEAPRALAKYAEALTLRVGHHGIACRVPPFSCRRPGDSRDQGERHHPP